MKMISGLRRSQGASPAPVSADGPHTTKSAGLPHGSRAPTMHAMDSSKRFEDLEVWKQGRDLVRTIYAITWQGEFSKDYGLKDQIRRAAVSITSNIAEGYERDGDREFLQYLSIAKGSVGEVRSQLHHALDAGYLNETEFAQHHASCIHLGIRLSRFISYLKNHRLGGTKYKPPESQT